MNFNIENINNTYDFSFTAASLRLSEMCKVAANIVNAIPFDYAIELGNGKESTGKRMYFEYTKRLNTLNSSELKILVNGDLISQKQIAFVSICRAYPFIRDFVIEIVREKSLMYDYEILDRDYLVFYRNKLESHPELETITEKTEKKIKQVLFKILEQADIIDNIKSRKIQIQLIDNSTLKAVSLNGKEWLKVLLMSDSDIQMLN